MAKQASETKGVAGSFSRLQCWVDSLILGIGIPSAIWAVSKFISVSIPAAIHGSPEQRFFFWCSAGVVVEWLFVIGLWFVLRQRRVSFTDLGVWRLGTWPAWVVALLLAALSIGSNLRILLRMHVPISSAFLPHGFHLFVALALGITAGFCEEVLKRKRPSVTVSTV
jgi:hypothetical protein